ncbi:ECIAI39_1904 family autotransporter adhesin [Escherichia coli]|uniref:ECIAI39_1904 family autotransporter adhesin n=1 Tax=Escherichia coli TaxID=562 RepID=UPI00207C0588|nr:ECIAI39_1904 family autotransporter adhesin [Escherichia coli]MDY9423029.1 ECIAI39_1904 family autotransporter adhesin [Escherichia coli]MDY9485941.1 ECIAI39_1904 family autotransporter adhesin [Escherichia coli]MDY9656678.1 ECIAI39_1904 family autotransporter adhesin [Escherichia coli]
MKLKKLPGFSLGLIALAVGNAYAEQFIQHEEHKHAVAIKDGEVKNGEVKGGEVKYIDNALVITTGNGSYGVSVAGVGSNLTINNGVIVTTGGLYPSDNSSLSTALTASAIVSEDGGAVTLRGNNTIVTTGDYSVGLLSQVDGNLNTDTIIRVNPDGSATPSFSDGDNTFIVTAGNHAVGVLACASPGSARACVSSLDEESTADTENNENSAKAILDMAKGEITTHGTESYAAYANGTVVKAGDKLDYTNASVTLTDVDITTHGDNAHAIAARQGTVSFNQGEIYTTGPDAAIAKIYNGGTVTLKNTSAVAHQGAGVVLESSINGQEATVDILSGSSLRSANEILYNKNETSNVTITDSEVSSAADVFINNIKGHLTVDATDSKITGSANLSTDDNTHTYLSLSDNSTWDIKADSTVSNLTVDNSTVYISRADGRDFEPTRLTITENYVGNNGVLHLRTELGDDNSATDKVVINGNTSGTTRVKVTNAGGSGAYTLNGIEIISVEGESNGEFIKDSRIFAGAYEYSLTRGNTEATNKNWYLTNFQATSGGETNSGGSSAPIVALTPVLRPEAGSYVANLAAANTLFVMRLNDRAGETRYIDPVTEQERSSRLWLRQIGGHNAWRDSNGQLRTTSHRYVSQLGADLLTGGFTDSDSWRLGVMAGYARDYNSTHSSVSDYRSKGSVRGYSAGLYATWFADDISKKGAYIDAWAQYSWFKNSVKGDELAYESYSAKGATVSLEAGYGFALNKSFGLEAAKYTWIFQPQAQAIWMGVDHNAHTEANGSRIENDANNNIQTRLGFRTFIRTQEKNSGPHGDDFEPFVEMNWLHNSKDFAVSMNGVKVEQDGARNLGEIKLGVNGNLNPAASVWGNVGVQLGDNGYNDTAVMVGLKYKF